MSDFCENQSCIIGGLGGKSSLRFVWGAKDEVKPFSVKRATAIFIDEYTSYAKDT